MRLTIGQKAVRVVKFLLGLRHPQVVRALSQYGFTGEELQRGWSLLAGLTPVSVDGLDSEPDPNVFAQLDHFENRWFPVAKATLGHRYPKVGEALFQNLSQTTGAGVAVSVGTFLARLGSMARGEGEFVDAGPDARRLLAERGLRDDVVADAAALIERTHAIGRAESPRLDREHERRAEEALWAWYLEWSAIARVAIRDRRLLRAMGFLGGKRRGGDGSSDEEAAEVEPAAHRAVGPRAAVN